MSNKLLANYQVLLRDWTYFIWLVVLVIVYHSMLRGQLKRGKV